MNRLFGIGENMTVQNKDESFKLHVHDNYEILLFLEGDAKYIVEQNVYTLQPYDIIVIRKNQLHRVMLNSPAKYHRMVLNVFPEFFSVNRCTEYEKQFIDPCSEVGSKIDAETVKNSGLFDAFVRIKEYSNNFTEKNTPIVRAGIIEILYLINNIKSYSKSKTDPIQLKEIISFINKNFTQNLSLDELEKLFYISKYHLCHIFPAVTGITVHQYITKKRLILAKDMIKSGTSASEAAKHSGFNNYSTFYRAYINEYGVSPNSQR